jgi:Cu(I)/Ag(I) efflux system membrane protein CusA/SilA
MQIVGYVNMWVQPISARIVMQDTGIQTPVGIKIKGNDIATHRAIGTESGSSLTGFPGTQSVIAERISQGTSSTWSSIRRGSPPPASAPTKPCRSSAIAIGGDNVVASRNAAACRPAQRPVFPEYLDTLDKVRNTPLAVPGGGTIRLCANRRRSVKKMPEMIRNDNGPLAGYVYVYLNPASRAPITWNRRSLISRRTYASAGYSLEWTAIINIRERALAIGADRPVTLLIIFVLLALAFRSMPTAS